MSFTHINPAGSLGKCCSASFLTVSLAVAAAFMAIIVLVPYHLDDYWYMSSLRGWYATGRLSTLVAELKSCWLSHYMTDNARLANLVYIHFLALPHAVGAVFTCIMFWLQLYLAARLSGLARRSWKWAVVLCAMFTFCLPWFENIFVLCYCFNYVWATTITLLVVLIFRRIGDMDVTAFQFAAVLCFAVVAGAWHEGFSMPVFCGMAASCVLWPRGVFTWRRGAFVLAYASGLAFLMCAPSMATRMAATEHFLSMVGIDMVSLLMLLKNRLLTLVFMCLYIGCLFNSKIRGRITTPFFLLLGVAVLVSDVIALAFPVGLRAGWLSAVLDIVGIMTLLRITVDETGSGRLMAIAKSVVAYAAGAAMLAHFSCTLYSTVVYRHNLRAVEKGYLQAGGKPFFVSLERVPESVSVMSLLKPNAWSICNRWSLQTMSMFYGLGDCRPVADGLACVTADAGRPIAGAPIRELGGRFFLPAEAVPGGTSDCGSIMVCWCDVSSGTFVSRRICTMVPFTSQADGRRYYSLVFDATGLIQLLMPTTAISFITPPEQP